MTKTLVGALLALGLFAGVANATPSTSEWGCGYGHLKIEKDSTVAWGCRYGW